MLNAGPAGKYQPSYGASTCIGCAPGFFSQLPGRQSALHCQACPQGTYAGSSGAVSCAPCAVNDTSSICAVASASAAGVVAAATSAVVLQQPTYLQGNAVLVGNVQLNMVIALVVVFAVTMGVYFLLPKSIKEHYVLRLDIYSRHHRPMTQEQRWSKEWKTALGGTVWCECVCDVVYKRSALMTYVG
jgi:hypothetical protein